MLFAALGDMQWRKCRLVITIISTGLIFDDDGPGLAASGWRPGTPSIPWVSMYSSSDPARCWTFLGSLFPDADLA